MALSVAFGAFVASLTLVLAAGIVRFLVPAQRLRALVLLAAWMLYAGGLGAAGVLGNAGLRPPGIAYVVVPAIALTAFLARSRTGVAIALAVPTWLLLGAQSLRVVVEVFLDRLAHAGRLPALMTFQGGNVDILIGISALVVAALCRVGRLDTRVAIAWNLAGMVSLANVVVRGILTSPAVHAIRVDAPSAIATYPFTFIPAFVVPMALMLHVLALRALREASHDGGSSRRTSRPALRSPLVKDYVPPSYRS